MIFEAWQEQGGAAESNGVVTLVSFDLGPHSNALLAFSAIFPQPNNVLDAVAMPVVGNDDR